MPDARWTKDEVFSKIHWEGGVAEAIMGYGLDSTVLPEGTPDVVVEAWNRLGGQAKCDVDTIQAWLDGDDLPNVLQGPDPASILEALRGPNTAERATP